MCYFLFRAVLCLVFIVVFSVAGWFAPFSLRSAHCHTCGPPRMDLYLDEVGVGLYVISGDDLASSTLTASIPTFLTVSPDWVINTTDQEYFIGGVKASVSDVIWTWWALDPDCVGNCSGDCTLTVRVFETNPATISVDPGYIDGNGSSVGSVARPFKTLSDAIAAVADGGTIIFKSNSTTNETGIFGNDGKSYTITVEPPGNATIGQQP